MTVWRYLAQRLPGGDWLHRDLPLADVQLTTAVSAPGGLTATIPLVHASLLDEDGAPLLAPWRTAIWAQADGQIRGGGIVTGTRMQDDGQTLRVECIGITGALVAGQPWTAGTQRLYEADPLDVVRMIYAHVQSQPGGDLGVQVDQATSPVTVGIPEDPTREAARLKTDATKTSLDAAKTTLDKAKKLADDTRKAALRAAGLTDTTGKVVAQDDEPSKTKKNLWYRTAKNRVHKVTGSPAEWVSVPAALPAARTAVAAERAHENAKTAHDRAKTANDTARQGFDEVRDLQDKDPFVLGWWTTHDLGAVIDDLASSTPFDSMEHTAWADDDSDQLVHRLELSYPRRGRRREDLRFVIGENVAVPPDAAWGEGFATDVMVLGAGEGSKMVRALQSTGGVGVRRVEVHTDKAIDRQQAANDVARRLAPGLRGGIDITSLQVLDHPHAPVGSLTPGDEIFLMGRLDWADLELWLRVMAITYQPDDASVIGLRVTPSLEGGR